MGFHPSNRATWRCSSEHLQPRPSACCEYEFGARRIKGKSVSLPKQRGGLSACRASVHPATLVRSMTATTAATEWFKIINEEDVESPALLIYPDRVQENIRRMITIAGEPTRL